MQSPMVWTDRTAPVTTICKNEYARIHSKHKYSSSDGYARCSAASVATQTIVAASHWRNRHIHSELNPPNLDQMTPDQFYFNVFNVNMVTRDHGRLAPRGGHLSYRTWLIRWARQPLHLRKPEINVPSHWCQNDQAHTGTQ